MSEAADRTRHLVSAAKNMVSPEHRHVREYLGLLDGSERALADALDKVAKAHGREPDVRNECHLLAHWSRRELDELGELIRRYGKAREAEPKRLGKAVSPQAQSGGFGLVRDLHDCWLIAHEFHMSLIVLDQAAKGLCDEQMRALVERVDNQNQRQLNWLLTRIKGGGSAGAHSSVVTRLPGWLWAPVVAAVLTVTVGAVGLWISAPWLFPSLGPTIFLQVQKPDLPTARP